MIMEKLNQMVISRNRVSHMPKRREIRVNDFVENRAKELVTRFPELYLDKSDVYRAGVLALYRIKIMNKYKDFGEVDDERIDKSEGVLQFFNEK